MRIRRRSVSIFVSPGPRRPTPAARAATATAAAGLPGQRLAPAPQSRQEVLQLRQLNLRLTLPALRVLGEYVEDQRRTVDDLDLDLLLQRPQLRGRQLAVADHGVGAGVQHHRAQLVDLAAADERRRVRPGTPLDQALQHLRAGGLGQLGELDQRVLGVGDGALRPDADEDHPLESQLAVLDLGDVDQFGGEPGDATQRVALLQLERHPRRRRPVRLLELSRDELRSGSFLAITY